MVTPEPVTTDLMDPSESQAGTNGYNHECEAYGGFPNYGVCLFTIEAHNDKRLPDGHPCSVAIQVGQCPAMDMQRRERSENRALYYIDRRAVEAAFEESRKVSAPVEIDRTDRNSESYKRGFAVLDKKPFAGARVVSKPLSTLKTKRTKPASDDLIAAGQDYATALNKAVKGLSLLEVAKQMQASREAK